MKKGSKTSKLYSGISSCCTTSLGCFFFSSANATPEFEGRGGEELGTKLSNTLYKVFNNKRSIDLKSLCICAGEHCWVLYVDVLVSRSVQRCLLLPKIFFFFNIYFFLVCKNKRKSALYTAAPFLHDCSFFCPPFERHWILTSDPAKILSSAAPQLFSAIINLLFLDRTSYFWTIIWLWELTTPVIFTIFWHILAQKTNK